MQRPDADLPYNVITRWLTRFQNDCGREVARAFPKEHFLGAFFVLVFRDEATRRAAAIDRRAISIGALARALGRPFETVRRQVARLRAMGLLTVDPDGVRIADGAAAELRIGTLLDALVRHFRALLTGLRASDVALPGDLDPVALARGPALDCALDIYLYAIEANGPLHRGWMELLIIGRTLIMNNAGIRNDPTLSRAFAAADAIAPADVRRPVTPAEVAREIGLPRQTVGRHLKAAVASGCAEAVGDGYLVSIAWLSHPQQIGNARRMVHHLRRALVALAKADEEAVGSPSQIGTA